MSCFFFENGTDASRGVTTVWVERKYSCGLLGISEALCPKSESDWHRPLRVEGLQAVPCAGVLADAAAEDLLPDRPKAGVTLCRVKES